MTDRYVSDSDMRVIILVAFLVGMVVGMLFGYWIENNQTDINCRRDTGWHWKSVDWAYDCTAKKRD